MHIPHLSRTLRAYHASTGDSQSQGTRSIIRALSQSLQVDKSDSTGLAFPSLGLVLVAFMPSLFAIGSISQSSIQAVLWGIPL